MEITDDRTSAANRLKFPVSNTKSGLLIEAGRVLVITNSDESPTIGDAEIPPKTSVLFVYDGKRFASIDSLRAPMQHLTGVQSLQANADLDIGNHTFSAAAFAFSPGKSEIPKNSLLFAGAGGLIKGNNGLSYSKGTLKVSAISVDTIQSNVDFQLHTIE